MNPINAAKSSEPSKTMATLYKLKIDVTKIDKTRLFKGKKGTYLDLDMWVEDEPDQYGNHGGLSHSQSKEERESKTRRIYVGNAVRIVSAAPEDRTSPEADPAAGTLTNGHYW